MMELKCPNKICSMDTEKVDEIFETRLVQSSDDLNADIDSTATTKVELWYCCFCGQYFRAYYELISVAQLSELKPDKKDGE